MEGLVVQNKSLDFHLMGMRDSESFKYEGNMMIWVTQRRRHGGQLGGSGEKR